MDLGVWVLVHLHPHQFQWRANGRRKARGVGKRKIKKGGRSRQASRKQESWERRNRKTEARTREVRQECHLLDFISNTRGWKMTFKMTFIESGL